MEKPLWEHHNVALVQRLQVHNIVERGYEPSADRSLNDDEDLRAAGVCVEGDDAFGRQVEAGYGDSEAVDSWELASNAGVTAALMMLVVLPATARPRYTKSLTVMEAAFLHG
ncbi:auxin-binding protein abp19a [Phtheirospermum japonicum]|uniref:Auxin-binding protein abp19a n=1 Tax=Phtheirospermum japonicum TaxID=374723 RepID=A0A830C8J1_9LAMI|nr:auxin-binding protein abp19a [Phtheirospermum japonicum]